MLRGLLAALCLTPQALAANEFPNRPIKLVIPYAPGGTAEPLARLMADAVKKRTGATIVIETRPGAAGNIGSAEVIRSDPDGYTLLLGANNNFVVNQYLFKNSTIRPERDFTLVSILADQCQVAYVTAGFPAKTFVEMVDYIKARPGEINFASPGAGTGPHLSGELLSDLYGLRMVHVPFNGGMAAVTAMLSGQVQLFLSSLSVGKAQVEAGKLKALAVTSPSRMGSLPDVPTTREAGAPQYTTCSWWAVAAPKGIPAASETWIVREFSEALNEPTIRARLDGLGFTVTGTTRVEFEDRVRRESQVYERLIQERKLAQ